MGPFFASICRSAPAWVFALALLGCAPEPEPPTAAGAPRLVAPALDGAVPSIALHRTPDGRSVLHLDRAGLEFDLAIEGGGEAHALAAFARIPGSDAAWAGLAEKRRGESWRVILPASHALWSELLAGAVLELEVGAFPRASYPALEHLFDAPDATLQARVWETERARATVLRSTAVLLVAGGPKVQLARNLLAGLRPAIHPDGSVPILPLRIRANDLASLSVAGEEVPRERWGVPRWLARSEEEAGRLLVVPWPRAGSGLLEKIPVVASDLYGRRAEVEVEFSAAPDAALAPRWTARAEEGIGRAFPDWGGAGDPSVWIDEAKDVTREKRLRLRRVSAGSHALLRWCFEPGEERLVELFLAKNAMARPGTTATERLLFAVPTEGGELVVDVPLPRNEDEGTPAAWTSVVGHVWPRASFPAGDAPAVSPGMEVHPTRRDLESYTLDFFRSEDAPTLEPLIAEDSPLSLPSSDAGRPVFEFEARVRFPARIEVDGVALAEPLQDTERVDVGAAYKSGAPRSALGRALRGFAVPWPVDAEGTPRTRFSVVVVDLCGRVTERRIEYGELAQLPPLGTLAPLVEPEGIPARDERPHLVVETAPGEGRCLRGHEWTVARGEVTDPLTVVRRRLTAFQLDDLVVRVVGPAARYAVELEELEGARKRIPGQSMGVFHVDAGKSLRVPFDLRGRGVHLGSSTAYRARLYLYELADRPSGDLPLGIEDGLAIRAKAIDVATVEFVADHTLPRLSVDLPQGSAVNPDAPMRSLGTPQFGFAIGERLLEGLAVSGVVVPMLDPYELDRKDPGGRQVGQEIRSYLVPWPPGEDGERMVTVSARGRRQQWVERAFAYRYDRRAPVPIASAAQLGENGERRCEVEADETLREVEWSADDPSAVPQRMRWIVTGTKASAAFPPSSVERSGRLRLVDHAGNQTVQAWSPDRS